MADKFMQIPNDDTQNSPYCRLKLVVETFETTNQNSVIVPEAKEEENVIIKL